MQKATLKNRLHLTDGFLVNAVSVLGNVSVPGARSPKNQGWIDVQRVQTLIYTPRKINMEPENTPLEEENHLPNHHFQVLC